MPSNTGIIGENYYRSFLIPFFGHGALLFSLFLFAYAGLILYSQYLHLRIIGITLILIPLLIWIDNAYITELFPAKNYINQLVEVTFQVLFGKAGLRLLEIILLVSGCFLMVYRSSINLAQFKRTKETKKQSKKQPPPKPVKHSGKKNRPGRRSRATARPASKAAAKQATKRAADRARKRAAARRAAKRPATGKKTRKR